MTLLYICEIRILYTNSDPLFTVHVTFSIPSGIYHLMYFPLIAMLWCPESSRDPGDQPWCARQCLQVWLGCSVVERPSSYLLLFFPSPVRKSSAGCPPCSLQVEQCFSIMNNALKHERNCTRSAFPLTTLADNYEQYEGGFYPYC